MSAAGAGSKLVEGEYVASMVMQWLAENKYEDALAALEREAGQTYEPDNLHRPSALLAALNDAYESEMLRGPSAFRTDEEEELNEPASGIYASEQASAFKALHTGNILSVRFSPHDSRVMATAGSDRTLKLSNFVELEEGGPSSIRAFPPSDAAILALDFHPTDAGTLLSCGMDGKARVYDVEAGTTRQVLPSGSKYVVRARWAPDGTFFCTASYDRHVRVFRREGDEYRLVAELPFVGAVEAVEFVPRSSVLVVACRDSNFLEYVDLAAGAARSRVNMNANGDNVVSFTAMDLAASPSERLLSVSTDKSRIIVFAMNTPRQARNLYGATNDGYSQPRHAWHPHGDYLLGTGQDNAVHVWEVGTSRCVARLAGHESVVRDLAYHPTRELLATCSFDKTVRLWRPPPGHAERPGAQR